MRFAIRIVMLLVAYHESNDSLLVTGIIQERRQVGEPQPETSVSNAEFLDHVDSALGIRGRRTAPTRGTTATSGTKVFHCGCKECDSTIWEKMVPDNNGNFSCGSRIEWVIDNNHLDELTACRIVAGEQFPFDECGPYCDPQSCNQLAGTTGSSAGRKHGSSGTTTQSSAGHCGCLTCNAAMWDTYASDDSGNFTCGERIAWSMNYQSMNEYDACIRISDVQFPTICGPSCNPRLCPRPRESTSTKWPLHYDTPVYFFPDYQNRVRFSGLWGDFTVEVEEALAGPNQNNFTRNTVSVVKDETGSNDELTMQFKYVPGSGWEASQVRIVLPDELMPFTYGLYKFSIKSIEHRNTQTGQVYSNVLPPSLTFGFFTWDIMDDNENHENWNHEVDIEIARWNIPDNDDLQYVVQPPGDIHFHRFRSGSNAYSLSQAGYTYQFVWNPGSIEWYTTAAGGHYYQYTTRQAIEWGLPDQVQCLPATMELRMNLWNLDSTYVTPTEMGTDDILEVVIDHVWYEPSSWNYMEDGSRCSKDCQCAPTSICLNTYCTSTV